MSAYGNQCPYEVCAKIYKSMHDLILHIENDHLDFSSGVLEQLEDVKPDSVPMSYILKYGKPGEVAEEAEPPTWTSISEDTPIILEAIPNNVFVTTVLECPPLYCRPKQIPTSNADKPFACCVPGCNKKYKNINGIKYHYINYHNKSFRASKNAVKPKNSTKRKGKQKNKTESFDQNNNPLQDINLHSYALPLSSGDEMYHSNPNLNYIHNLGSEDEHFPSQRRGYFN